MVDGLLWEQEDAGSIPVTSTNEVSSKYLFYRKTLAWRYGIAREITAVPRRSRTSNSIHTGERDLRGLQQTNLHYISVKVCTQFESANGVRKEGRSFSVPQKTLTALGRCNGPPTSYLRYINQTEGTRRISST